MHFSDRDRLAVPVPFYHCFGTVLANLMCFSVGTGIIAGAPCPPELMTRVMDEMHCTEILIGYGETEASPLTHLTARSDSPERRIGAVGQNLPHQEVKVIDTASGATLPLGKIGEVCFRGYHVMRGYYNDAEKSVSAIDPAGWIYSGDLGCMDKDGYLSITGRRKEMIIRGGENIYPREIEDFLFTHPKIAEVAVFGVPDDRFGEQVAAWIQLHSVRKASEEEIRNFCKDEIAYFKIPEYIRFVDESPLRLPGNHKKSKCAKRWWNC
jgi:fatty-acyl-CoA synthase